MAAWWLLPDLTSLRPEVEGLLKKEMALTDLKLGKLSWRWAWNFSIHAEDTDLKTAQGSLSLAHTAITVDLNTIDLLSGQLLPKRIRLANGDMQLRIVKTDTSEPVTLTSWPGLLSALQNNRAQRISIDMDDMKLSWQWGKDHGTYAPLSLRWNATEQSLSARAPGWSLSSQSTPDAGQLHASLHFTDSQWLPSFVQAYTAGDFGGQLELEISDTRRWLLRINLQAEEQAQLKPGIAHLPNITWQNISAEANITYDKSSEEPVSLALRKLHWQSGQNNLNAAAEWSADILSWEASTTSLPMAHMWPWLSPLMDDAKWRQWLNSMQQGTINPAHAEGSFHWLSPWSSSPTQTDLASMAYHVRGHVDDADISLGIDQPMLKHAKGQVELNETALHAEVAQIELPEIGRVAGTLDIPWEPLVIQVNGKGSADVGRLQQWLDPEGAEALQWRSAPAQGGIQMRWNPEQDMPEQLQVELEPSANWQLQIKESPIIVESGKVIWTLKSGLDVQKLRWHSQLLQGTTSLNVALSDEGSWHLYQLSNNVHGDFAPIVSHYRLPVDVPTGQIHFTSELQKSDQANNWHSTIDLSQAGWNNLLGTRKSMGLRNQIKASGSFNYSLAQPSLLINRIACDDPMLKLEGRGAIDGQRVRLNLEQLQTNAFQGSILATAPLNHEPWEMSIEADYLKRRALPESLPDQMNDTSKPWSLRANIAHFDWHDASMHQVEIRLASNTDSTGTFKARSIENSGLLLQDVSAIFTLPGAGRVDMRQLKGRMDDLQLTLSATLNPYADKGVIWRGFAIIDGDFGQLMKRSQLSNIFEEGTMHAVFSGQGIALRDQAWWDGLSGRLRLRVDDGRTTKGSTMTKLLAATSIADLPALLTGQRADFFKPGFSYKRLQMEILMNNDQASIQQFAMRSPALDMAGQGSLNLSNQNIDMQITAQPLQNLDAILGKIPLLRDILGGSAHSLFRKIYHVSGPVADAKMESISAEQAGLEKPGLIEDLMGLPERWFGKAPAQPTLP